MSIEDVSVLNALPRLPRDVRAELGLAMPLTIFIAHHKLQPERGPL
jgi:hypothetical protein